jgi:hypothetical protein|tara:strand:+ start:245 stop:526 length:282 start_codon:yes stop_codon:yes gene_type:complete
MRYAILVDIDDETFIDGNYEGKDLAMDMYCHWSETYPYLTFQLAAVVATNHPIPDELFMPRNKKILAHANRVEESKVSPKWTRGPGASETKLH